MYSRVNDYLEGTAGLGRTEKKASKGKGHRDREARDVHKKGKYIQGKNHFSPTGCQDQP